MNQIRINVIKQHKQKCDNNFKLYEHLTQNGIFADWQVVALFYSALNDVKAYLYSFDVIQLNSIKSHNTIKFLLTTIQESKRSKVIQPYEWLYIESRDARYRCKVFTDERVQEAYKTYQEVLKLTKIPVQLIETTTKT